MRNARVIIACRNEEKGKLALKIIKDKTGKDEVFMKTLDVSSLSSIRRFSDEIHKEEQALHILINNAGICSMLIFVHLACTCTISNYKNILLLM